MLQRKWSYHVAVYACPPPKNGHHKKRVCLFQDVSCGFIFSVTLAAPWFVLVFPQPGSEVHGSLKVKFGRSNGADGVASAFSLFQGQVYFHFQSPPLFPTHSAFSRARLRKGRSNVGNWKTCSSPDCCWAHLAELRVEGWARPRAHALSNVSVGGSCTFIWGLLSVKAPYFEWSMRLCEQIVPTCQGSAFVFMDAHSVTSCLSIYACWENNTRGLFRVCCSF